MLTIAGVVFVPGWRAYWTRRWHRRLLEGLAAAGIAVGAALPISLAFSQLSLAQTLTTPGGSFHPPGWVIRYALAAAVLGGAAVRYLPVPGWVPRLVARRTFTAVAVVGAAAGLLIAWSGPRVADNTFGSAWQVIACSFAWLGILACTLYVALGFLFKGRA